MQKVNLKRLLNLVNPFEVDIYGFGGLVSNELIESKIVSKDIFPISGDGSFENHIRKIAYYVVNSGNNTVRVNLPVATDLVLDTIVPKGFDNEYMYVAELYLGKKEVEVDLESNVKSAKILLGLNLLDSVQQEEQKIVSNDMSTWKILDGMISDTWENQSYVLENVSSRNFLDHLNYIPVSFWDDESFVKKLIKLPDIEKLIPLEYVFKSGYVKAVLNNGKFFTNHLFESVYEKELELNLKGESVQLNFIELFNEKINNSFYVKYNISSIPSKYMRFFSSDVVNSDEVLNHLYSQGESSYLSWDPLSDGSADGRGFKDKDMSWLDLKSVEWKDSFLKANSSFFIRCRYRISNYKKMCSDWIGNKDEVLSRFSGNDDKFYLIFYDLLPDVIKSDVEVSRVAIKHNHNMYNRLPESHQLDDSIVKSVCEPFGPNGYKRTEVNWSYMNKKLSCEMIDVLIEGGYYDSLQGTVNAGDYLSLPSSIMKIPSSQFRWLMQGKLFKSIVNGDRDLVNYVAQIEGCYDLLLKKDRDNEEVILSMLSNFKYFPSKFDTDRFLSKDFCTKVLSKNMGLAKCVPAGYWLEKDFIKGVLKLVDNNFVTKSILDFFPPQVKLVFDTFKVSENYYNFFEKYDMKIALNDLAHENKVIKHSKI